MLPFQAALAVLLCLAILVLPYLDHATVMSFRILYLLTCAAWMVPLTVLQRWLWRRQSTWVVQSVTLLVVTYGMSVLNNVAGRVWAIHLGLETEMRWSTMVRGIDSCWLAFIAFCALHVSDQ